MAASHNLRCISAHTLTAIITTLILSILLSMAAVASVPALEQVVVTATLEEKTLLLTPASVVRLDKTALDQYGFQVGSDELRGQSGVFFRRGSGDNDDFLIISFRGVEGNHGHGAENFLGLVDGIPFIGGDEEILISEVPYDAVDNIEIVRGPMSALYGRGGISGVINYRLKEPGEQSTTVRVYSGSDDYYKATLQSSYAINDKHSLMANVAYEQSQGWRNHTERDSRNVFLRSKSVLSDSLTLDVYVNLLDKDYDSASAIPTTVDGVILPVKGGDTGFIGSRDGLGKRTDLSMVTARLMYTINEQLNVRYALHNRRIDSTFQYDFLNANAVDAASHSFSVQGFESSGVTDAWYTDLHLRWKTDAHQLITGLSLEKVALDEQDYWTGQFFGGDFFSQLRINYLTGAIINSEHPGFFQRAKTSDADTTNTFTGAYVQYDWQLTPRWELSLGARYDQFERNADMSTGRPVTEFVNIKEDEARVSPKAALRYQFSNQQMVYVSYGEGFASNFGPVWSWNRQTYARNVKPSVLHTLEVGSKGHVAAGAFSYEVALYRLSQDDRVVQTTNPDGLPHFLFISAGQYEATGVESRLSWQVSNKLSTTAQYSYIDAKWADFVIPSAMGATDLTGNVPVGVPGHMATWQIDYHLTNELSTRLAYEYYGDYYYTQNNRLKGGGYDVWNASLHYAVKTVPGFAVNVSVTNVLDDRYYYRFGDMVNATYVTPGMARQLRLSVAYTF